MCMCVDVIFPQSCRGPKQKADGAKTIRAAAHFSIWRKQRPPVLKWINRAMVSMMAVVMGAASYTCARQVLFQSLIKEAVCCSRQLVCVDGSVRYNRRV